GMFSGTDCDGPPPCGVTLTLGTAPGCPALAGADFVVTGFALGSTLCAPAEPRVVKTDRNSDVSMNRAAEIVVAFDNTIAEPRGPNVVCEPIPPNAPARSAALPLCSSTTTIRKKQTKT